MFRLVVLSVLLSNVLSSSTPSSFSRKLLLQQQQKQQRRLEDGAEGGEGEEEDAAADMDWLADYNVVYAYCFHSEQSVSYQLCPRSDNAQGRNSCMVDCQGGAEYLADLAFFVDAFTEAQMEAREYRCEYARENCQYDDDGLCFQDENLQYCQEDWGDEMDIQEYLECAQIDDDYYVGPYCAEDSVSIFLGVFTDADCTEEADDNSAFYNVYGYELPYSTESIIGSSNDGANCASCKEHALEEDKNEGDQEDEDEVLEQCENMYTYTYTKCETNLDIDDPDTDGCDYVKELKSTEDVVLNSSGGSTGGRSTAAKVWLSFLFIGLAIMGAVAYYVHKKKRAEQKAKAASITSSKHGPSNQTLLE